MTWFIINAWYFMHNLYFLLSQMYGVVYFFYYFFNKTNDYSLKKVKRVIFLVSMRELTI